MSPQPNTVLVTAYERIRADLLARLHAWMQDTDDPLLDGIPTPPIHRFAMRALKGELLEER